MRQQGRRLRQLSMMNSSWHLVKQWEQRFTVMLIIQKIGKMKQKGINMRERIIIIIGIVRIEEQLSRMEKCWNILYMEQGNDNNFKYYWHMNKRNEKQIRRINKIYPPQMTQANGQIYIYSPLDHWIEAHTHHSMKNMIPTHNQAKGLVLSTKSEQLLMQSYTQLWFDVGLDDLTAEMVAVVKSQKMIVSQTVKINGNLINIDQDGAINIWHQRCHSLQKINNQNEEYTLQQLGNPQSLTLIQDEPFSHQSVDSLIHLSTAVNKTVNGHSLTSIQSIQHNQFITLHTSENRNRIMNTELTDCDSYSHYYRCDIPVIANNISIIKNNICAYGGSNALLIDARSQSVIVNLNDREDTAVNCIKDEKDSNLFVMCRNRNVVVMDSRKQGEIMSILVQSNKDVDNCQIITQNGVRYCFVSHADNGSVVVYQL